MFHAPPLIPALLALVNTCCTGRLTSWPAYPNACIPQPVSILPPLDNEDFFTSVMVGTPGFSISNILKVNDSKGYNLTRSVAIVAVPGRKSLLTERLFIFL